MEESQKVKEAYHAYVTRRKNLIEALGKDGDSFHRTDYVDLSTLSRCLQPKLPPSTMLINFTSTVVPEYWLCDFASRCEAWLLSTALYSEGLGKEDRSILFKKINHMTKMQDIAREVSAMKDYEYEDNDEVDDDVIWCDGCDDHASCIFWNWCDTCQKDTIWYTCSSCSKPCKNICKSCRKDVAAAKCP